MDEEKTKLDELELLVKQAEDELEWLQYHKLLYKSLFGFFILATIVANAALWLLLR